VHAGAVQVCVPALHTPLAQSPATRQAFAVAQGRHPPEPPQSTSVSVPFLIVSVQPAATHFFAVASHLRLMQSALTAQAFVFAHFVVHEPPQSTSVSVPFFTTSAQLGAVHFFVVASQLPLAQSAEIKQAFASAHFKQLPPQSMSVSVPFFFVSEHEAGGGGGGVVVVAVGVVVVVVGAGVGLVRPASSVPHAASHGPAAAASSTTHPTALEYCLRSLSIRSPDAGCTKVRRQRDRKAHRLP
jgi:hypothetical protein